MIAMHDLKLSAGGHEQSLRLLQKMCSYLLEATSLTVSNHYDGALWQSWSVGRLARADSQIWSCHTPVQPDKEASWVASTLLSMLLTGMDIFSYSEGSLGGHKALCQPECSWRMRGGLNHLDCLPQSSGGWQFQCMSDTSSCSLRRCRLSLQAHRNR